LTTVVGIDSFRPVTQLMVTAHLSLVEFFGQWVDVQAGLIAGQGFLPGAMAFPIARQLSIQFKKAATQLFPRGIQPGFIGIFGQKVTLVEPQCFVG